MQLARIGVTRLLSLNNADPVGVVVTQKTKPTNGNPKGRLKIALFLFLLHIPLVIVVNHASLPLRGCRQQHFLDDLGECCRLRFNGPR